VQRIIRCIANLCIAFLSGEKGSPSKSQNLVNTEKSILHCSLARSPEEEEGRTI